MCSFPNIYAPPGIRKIIEIPHGLWWFSALPDSSTLIFLVGLSQFSSSDISISSSRRMPMSCSLWAFRSSWKLRLHERQSLSQWSFSVLWLTHEHLEPAAFPFQTLPPPDLGKPPEGYRRWRWKDRIWYQPWNNSCSPMTRQGLFSKLFNPSSFNSHICRKGGNNIHLAGGALAKG